MTEEFRDDETKFNGCAALVHLMVCVKFDRGGYTSHLQGLGTLQSRNAAAELSLLFQIRGNAAQYVW